MADTLENTSLPSDVWVDLYADTGIAVGSQLLVQNIGVCDVYLATQLAEPTDETAYQIMERSQFAINEPGDSGAWAFCKAGGAVNVRLS